MPHSARTFPRSNWSLRSHDPSARVWAPALSHDRRLVAWGHGSGGAVDGDELSRVEALGGVTGADDGGDSVFAGDERGVSGEGAAVGDDGGCSGEQRRPCRCGRFGDEDIAVAKCGEVLRSVHYADWAGGAAG